MTCVETDNLCRVPKGIDAHPERHKSPLKHTVKDTSLVAVPSFVAERNVRKEEIIPKGAVSSVIVCLTSRTARLNIVGSVKTS